MTETELRETLAPKIAAKLVARCASLNSVDAHQLAYEIIAAVQAAQLAAQAGTGDGSPPWTP